jgi:thiol-disulfide isomerase/thioredoxin
MWSTRSKFPVTSRKAPALGRGCLLSFLLFLVAAGGVSAGTSVGDRFPSFAVAGMEGNIPPTEGKIVLVDFWASWCSPCKASFPAFARLQTDFAARGLTIIAVSVDEDPGAYGAFLKKMQPTFFTARDTAHELAKAVDVPAMPTSFLIGRDGRVRYLHRGFHGSETDQQLRTEIEQLLNEKPPSS